MAGDAVAVYISPTVLRDILGPLARQATPFLMFVGGIAMVAFFEATRR